MLMSSYQAAKLFGFLEHRVYHQAQGGDSLHSRKAIGGLSTPLLSNTRSTLQEFEAEIGLFVDELRIKLRDGIMRQTSK